MLYPYLYNKVLRSYPWILYYFLNLRSLAILIKFIINLIIIISTILVLLFFLVLVEFLYLSFPLL
jgi:hypothetical protein